MVTEYVVEVSGKEYQRYESIPGIPCEFLKSNFSFLLHQIPYVKYVFRDYVLMFVGYD